MRIERIAIAGFRNLERTVIEPGSAFNVVHGDNGAGKTSLIEAIWYMSALRSFRSPKSEHLVTLGEVDASIEARIAGGAALHVARVGLSRSHARKLSIDGKRPRSIAAWHAMFPMVLFHPGEINLSAGPASARRAFLDRVLEQMDPAYSSSLASYGKALSSRNRLLKRPGSDPRAIRAYDEILASAGAVVGTTRAGLIRDLSPLVEGAFAEVVGEHFPIRVEYRPRVEPTVAAIREALGRSFEKDLDRGFTAEGPHGDDLGLDVVDRAPVRHHASQGQHRALVLALKVAELDVLTKRASRVPILLLDDVSSELDRTRNRRLFDRLARMGGQVFLTTTHAEHILLDENRTDFAVTAGRIERRAA